MLYSPEIVISLMMVESKAKHSAECMISNNRFLQLPDKSILLVVKKNPCSEHQPTGLHFFRKLNKIKTVFEMGSL
jgi:hypothetical protein